MSGNKIVITLNLPVYNRYMKRDGEVRCHQCGDELTLQSRAFSRGSGRRATNVHKVLYCMDCADALNYL